MMRYWLITFNVTLGITIKYNNDILLVTVSGCVCRLQVSISPDIAYCLMSHRATDTNQAGYVIHGAQDQEIIGS